MQPDLEQQLQLKSPPGQVYDHSLSFLKICCVSFIGQIDELNGDVVVKITIPTSFKSLMVPLISGIPPGMHHCIWFTILLDKSSPGEFCLAFPTIIALTLQIWEPMWKFCQLLRMSIPSIHSGTGETLYWTHCEMDLSKNSIDHLPP